MPVLAPARVFAPLAASLLLAISTASPAQSSGTWSFAVSGDSRNCGDFVMPAIAARVKAEGNAFYWHLGDFRWMTQPDQDLLAMTPGGSIPKPEYQKVAWDDFLKHQMAAFKSTPVFLGRGNHEVAGGMTREGFIAKFSDFLNRPEIVSQRQKDGPEAAPAGPWYHWVKDGVDFITLDNATHEEFSDAQLRWLRGVLDHDLAPGSSVHTIVAGMHEALPHSTGSEHAMDDWDLGVRTGELVYTWFYDAQAAGKHVYLLASHSHYYSPNIYNTAYWKQHSRGVVPGTIIGSAGAQRYQLPPHADKNSKAMIYGFLQGTVKPDGTIDFALQELSEKEMLDARWAEAPAEAIHDCYIHNGGGE